MEIILTIIVTFLLVSGQILWKMSLNELVFKSTNLYFYIDLIKSPKILMGIFFYIIGTLIWFKVMTMAPFSKIYPILSMSYILGMFAGSIFFNEVITIVNWIGAVLISLGVILVIK